jgi:hypothetical protein
MPCGPVAPCGPEAVVVTTVKRALTEVAEKDGTTTEPIVSSTRETLNS